MATPEDIKISKHWQEIMRGIDHMLEHIAGKKMGCIFITFSFHEEGEEPKESAANYGANFDDRPMVIAELRKLADRLEAGHPDVPAHKIN